MSSGVNYNINGANHVKWIESQSRWSESHQVLCSLVKPNIGFQSCQAKKDLWPIYWDSLHIIDVAKPKIEGVNYDKDGATCQVVEYFLVQLSQIQSNEIDGVNYEMDGVKQEIGGVNHKIDGGNHVKQSNTLQYT